MIYFSSIVHLVRPIAILLHNRFIVSDQ